MNNLQSLIAKMDAIEESATMAQTESEDTMTTDPEFTDPDSGGDEENVTECGDDMVDGGGDKQISMSMQDLLALINGIQQGDIPSAGGDDGDVALLGDEYGNDAPGGSHSHVAPVAAVTPTGDDMFSKGKEAPKVNGGGNPMEEALSELYAAVKARQLDELSKSTLGSYAKKASDPSKKNSSMNLAVSGERAYKNGFGADGDTIHPDDRKANKRADGIGKAIDKLSLKEANQMARKLRK